MALVPPKVVRRLVKHGASLTVSIEPMWLAMHKLGRGSYITAAINAEGQLVLNPLAERHDERLFAATV